MAAKKKTSRWNAPINATEVKDKPVAKKKKSEVEVKSRKSGGRMRPRWKKPTSPSSFAPAKSKAIQKGHRMAEDMRDHMAEMANHAVHGDDGTRKWQNKYKTMSQKYIKMHDNLTAHEKKHNLRDSDYEKEPMH